MSHAVVLQQTPCGPVQVARDCGEPSLISFMDEEDCFMPTPAASATNSSNASTGHVRLVRPRLSESEPSSTSASSCSSPVTPSFLTRGADMPADMLAMLDYDPMPMLPPSMMDQFALGPAMGPL